MVLLCSWIAAQSLSCIICSRVALYHLAYTILPAFTVPFGYCAIKESFDDVSMESGGMSGAFYRHSHFSIVALAVLVIQSFCIHFSFSAHLRITYALDNFLDSCQFKSTGYDSFVLTQFDKLYVIKVFRVDSFESSEQLVRWSNSAVP
jgi:hypothetical protein